MENTEFDFVDPDTGEALKVSGEMLISDSGRTFPIIDGVPRFGELDNYTDNFGFQWNLFDKTQIDSGSAKVSATRFWTETGWDPKSLAGQKVLEAGSGAGRFTGVLLHQTEALLASFDYSNAVAANRRTYREFEGAGRFLLAQASIYEIPFADESFDKVFCLGVLQHTPDFRQAVKALYEKLKPGGELVVDFYPIKGWYTKFHTKYLLRPFTKRMNHKWLLWVIRAMTPFWIAVAQALDKLGLHALTRFLPICDIRGTMPQGLDKQTLREWVELDTFDQYSPEYDNPQRIETVCQWLTEMGAEVTFASFISWDNWTAAVVRAHKPNDG